MNFLTNAVKCTKSGYIKMGYGIEREGLRIYVEDTGIGIPDDLHDKVFTRFEKLNEFSQGTGLGLTISQSYRRSGRGRSGLHFKTWCRIYFLGMVASSPLGLTPHLLVMSF